MRRISGLAFGLALAMAAGVTLLQGPSSPSRVLVDGVEEPVALAALSGGGFRFGDRATGAIYEVADVEGAGRSPRLRLAPRLLARLTVATEGQRGLLGLAVDGAGRTFAAWTRPDRRLVVGQVVPGPIRLVWEGPATANLGNGGHLEFAPGGRLVVGVGDLQAPARVGDPSAPNGKLLALDPDGAAGQRPEVLAGGWNNPFAFTWTPGDTLWVADNAPGREPERLVAVGPGGARTVTELAGGQRAPAGMVALDEDTLALCAFVTGDVTLHRITPHRTTGRRADPAGERIAGGCRRGLTLLRSGDLAYAAHDQIRIVSGRSGGWTDSLSGRRTPAGASR